MIDLSKDGYFLKSEGHAFEFTSELAATSLKHWLSTKGVEVGCIDVFHDPMRDIWVLTQYMRVLKKVSDNKDHFTQESKAVEDITKANTGWFV